MKLLLLDVSLEKLQEVQKELGNDVDIIQFDITNSQNIEEVVNYVKAHNGFDHLLHFAGVSESIGNNELIYKINLIGTQLLLNALYDYIKPKGVIINTSSMTGHLSPVSEDVSKLLSNPLDDNFLDDILKITKVPTQAYSWSKRAVIDLTRAEGAKWGQKNARIISISPGAILTPMVEFEMKNNKDAIDQVVHATPMKRIGMPEDIINLVEFLISDKASFITGTDILIDGGVTEILGKYQQKK